MGIEPTTTCLGSKSSTTELHPRIVPVLCLKQYLYSIAEVLSFVLLHQYLHQYVAKVCLLNLFKGYAEVPDCFFLHTWNDMGSV